MADYEYINSTGVIVPDTSDILDDVRAEFKTALGDDLSLDPSTPQGRMIEAETEARARITRNNAALANQINPNVAGGIFLRSIGYLTGLGDQPQTYTVIPNVALTGVPGAIIPEGVRAATANGDQFRLVSGVLLDGSGNATGTFQAMEGGAIPAPANTLTNIVAGYTVLGWETVNNPDAGIMGKNRLSDSEYRDLRRNTLALQMRGEGEAVTSLLWNTPGVVGVQMRENTTNAQDTIDGITLDPHSIWVAVDGGTNQDVAEAIHAGKSGGCDYNGSTSVVVTDAHTGQSYTVKFDRPTETAIKIRITAKYSGTSSDPVQDVKNAVMSYVRNEVPGNPGFILGLPGRPFEVAAAINDQVPNIHISNVEFSAITPDNWSNSVWTVDLDEKLTVQESSISVVLT